MDFFLNCKAIPITLGIALIAFHPGIFQGVNRYSRKMKKLHNRPMKNTNFRQQYIVNGSFHCILHHSALEKSYI